MELSANVPLATPSELPSTSGNVVVDTTTATSASGSGDWVHFDNSSDDVASASASVSVSASTAATTNDTTTNGKEKANGVTATNITTTSATAYSFTGSALGSDSIANLNENMSGGYTKPDITDNATNTSRDNDNENDDKNDDSLYECNICLDTAKDAVVSMCGHLFCWPCLHQWLETRPNRKLCPVCKAAVDKDKVIPLYGRNTTRQEDPRNKVPPRPAGQRTEPEPQQGFQGFGFGDGFHMSFGIGAFPFGYFASSFNFGDPRPAAANRGTTQYEDEQQLSKLFLYLAFLCIAWLLFA